MAHENDWRARKIQAELLKLGLTVSLATVSRYLPRRELGLLYVWFVIDHGRRRILHFNVTAHPTAPWVIQHHREAFSDETAPRYLIYGACSSTTPTTTMLISSRQSFETLRSVAGSSVVLR